MTERNHVYEVPLDKIHADPEQPRKTFDPIELRGLAESIKQHGLLQPIMVKPDAQGFMIIHGERRYRAHQIAHKPTIKCIITEDHGDTLDSVRIVENVVRADLAPLELAHAFKRMVDEGKTHQEIADSINKSRAYVTQRLNLLNLPTEKQQQLESGIISFAEARELNKTEPECYHVTINDLKVPAYLKDNGYTVTNVQDLYAAYRSDLATIRRALRGGGQ